MKYLINANLKVIRKGEFVEASEVAGEFIYDDIQNGLTVATLRGIAEANNLKLKGKKHDELVESIAVELSTLKIPEVKNMTDTQKATKIIEDGVAAGKSDDEMLVEIVQSGISFKSATRMFKQIMEEKGLRVSTKDRVESATKVLTDIDFAPKTYADVKAAIKKLCDEVADTNEKQATIAIRKYAKAKEIVMPKAEKGEKKVGSAGGFKGKMLEWMVGNADSADLAGFAAWMTKNKRKESMTKRFTPVFEAMQKLAVRMMDDAKAA